MKIPAFLHQNRLLLLSLFSGLLLALAWPARGLPLLAFVAFVPLLFVEEELYQNRSSNKSVRFFLFAWGAFLIWNLLTTWWIMFATLPGMITAVLLNSLFMAIPWWLMHLYRRIGSKRQGVFPIVFFWLGFEFLHTKWDLSWNWLDLGNVFAGWPRWVQWYEFTGTAGGAIWVLLFNLVLFYLIRELRITSAFTKKARWYSAIATALLIVPLALSLRIYATYVEKVDPVEVVIVQPAEDPYQNPQTIEEAVGRTKRMIALAASMITDSTKFVVTPEATLPEGIWRGQEGLNRHVLLMQDFMMRNPQINWVAGSLVYQLYDPATTEIPYTARPLPATRYYFDTFNAAVMFDQHGQFSYYYKSMLVPGIERMPFFRVLRPVGRLVEKFGGTSGSLGTQDYRGVFTHTKTGEVLGPVICYESIYGDFMSGFMRNGATMIFVLTEDGWWRRTPGHRQHHEYARLRAIEFRRPVVRAAGTGISSFIDQRGAVQQRTQWWEPTAIRGTVNQNSELTYFARVGNVAGRIAVFFSGLLILAMLSARIMQRKSQIKQ